MARRCDNCAHWRLWSAPLVIGDKLVSVGVDNDGIEIMEFANLTEIAVGRCTAGPPVIGKDRTLSISSRVHSAQYPPDAHWPTTIADDYCARHEPNG